MAEAKTPRELLHERLERNAKKLELWPDSVRSAISTASLFPSPAPTATFSRGERRDASSVTEPASEE